MPALCGGSSEEKRGLPLLSSSFEVPGGGNSQSGAAQLFASALVFAQSGGRASSLGKPAGLVVSPEGLVVVLCETRWGSGGPGCS